MNASRVAATSRCQKSGNAPVAHGRRDTPNIGRGAWNAGLLCGGNANAGSAVTVTFPVTPADSSNSFDPASLTVMTLAASPAARTKARAWSDSRGPTPTAYNISGFSYSIASTAGPAKNAVPQCRSVRNVSGSTPQ